MAATADAMRRHITAHENCSEAEIEDTLAFSKSSAGKAFFTAGV